MKGLRNAVDEVEHPDETVSIFYGLLKKYMILCYDVRQRPYN